MVISHLWGAANGEFWFLDSLLVMSRSCLVSLWTGLLNVMILAKFKMILQCSPFTAPILVVYTKADQQVDV